MSSLTPTVTSYSRASHHRSRRTTQPPDPRKRTVRQTRIGMGLALLVTLTWGFVFVFATGVNSAAAQDHTGRFALDAPTSTPAPVLSLPDSVYDIQQAHTGTAQDGSFTVALPPGWQIKPSDPGYFATPGQNAMSLYVLIADSSVVYRQLKLTGTFDSPLAALQAYANSFTSSDYAVNAVFTSRIGMLDASTFHLYLLASKRETSFFMAALPDGSLLYISASADSALWDRAQPVLTFMANSLRLAVNNTPTPTTSETPTAMPTQAGSYAAYTSYGAPVGSIAFSSDGKLALVASGVSGSAKMQGQNFAAVVDVRTGLEVRRLSGAHSNFVISVALSPDGKLAMTGSRDATAVLWDLASGKPLHIFKGKHTDWVSGVAFAPDSKSVVTTGRDGQIWLWDAQTGDPIRAFVGDSAWVNNAVFLANGTLLFTGSDDKTARLWDVATGKEVRQFHSNLNGINLVAAAHSGDYLATGDGANDPAISYVTVWATTNNQEPVARFDNDHNSISSIWFLPGDQLLLIADYGGNVIVWDWKHNARIIQMDIPDGFENAANVSPDGQVIAVGAASGLTLFNTQALGVPNQ